MNAGLSKYLFTNTVDVTKFCNGESHFIILREPTVAEFKILSKMAKMADNGNDIEQQMESTVLFCGQLPTLITDHDFFDESEKTKKLTSKEIAEFISSKTDMMMHVLTEYMESLPLVRSTEKK